MKTIKYFTGVVLPFIGITLWIIFFQIVAFAINGQ
jgi:hypothetical protein